MAVMDPHKALELHKAEEEAERRFHAAMKADDMAATQKAADEWSTASRKFSEYVLAHIKPYKG